MYISLTNFISGDETKLKLVIKASILKKCKEIEELINKKYEGKTIKIKTTQDNIEYAGLGIDHVKEEESKDRIGIATQIREIQEKCQSLIIEIKNVESKEENKSSTINLD